MRPASRRAHPPAAGCGGSPSSRYRPCSHSHSHSRFRHDQRDGVHPRLVRPAGEYGFNGVDIDLGNGVNPAYMASALEQLESDAGAGLIIALAPQTVDTQSAGDDCSALALDIKSILTMINTQYDNSGTMNGCDGNVYAEGTAAPSSRRPPTRPSATS